MDVVKNYKKTLSLFLLSLFLIAVPFSLYCYGADATKQISSLLSPQQLKQWIDNGYRDERGLRVVILDTSFGPPARTDYVSWQVSCTARHSSEGAGSGKKGIQPFPGGCKRTN